jgi:hypothetical protein
MPNDLAKLIIAAFTAVESQITTVSQNATKSKISDEVLRIVAPHLQAIGFRVETGKKSEERIRVPVLYGLNGKKEKCFDADAYHEEGRFVIEIEAGGGTVGYAICKDLIEACVMDRVDYLAIALPHSYRIDRHTGKGAGKSQRNNGFEAGVRLANTLYASNRLKLPLRGLLLIGY